MKTERLESMSPSGSLCLYRQDDGDIVVTVNAGDDKGQIARTASIEICTPGPGRGGSKATWKALVQLMGAMAFDNLSNDQVGRRPDFVDDAEQWRLVEVATESAEDRDIELASLRAEVAELRQSFDLYYAAMERGRKLYQEAHGTETEWPDAGDQACWLLEQIAQLRERVDKECETVGNLERENITLRDKLAEAQASTAITDEDREVGRLVRELMQDATSLHIQRTVIGKPDGFAVLWDNAIHPVMASVLAALQAAKGE